MQLIDGFMSSDFSIAVLNTAILPFKHPIRDLANTATQKLGENPNIIIDTAVPNNPINKIFCDHIYRMLFPIVHNRKIDKTQMMQINNQNIWRYQSNEERY